MSVVTTIIDEETGDEKKRLINKMRWKGFGPASIMFSEKEVRRFHECFAYICNIAVQVPTKPPPNCEELRDQFDQGLLKDLEKVS